MKKPILHLQNFIDSTHFPSLLSDSFLDSCLFYKQTTRDVYKPQSTRGHGPLKEGYCDRCDKWYRLKNSSYWYHMNFIHGINSRGYKYPDPEYKIIQGKLYGHCCTCNDWIFIGYKMTDRSCKYGWYKHCQKMHNGNKSS